MKKYIIFVNVRTTKIYVRPDVVMELRQLKYFVRTAQTLNFSEAARSLYVSQSTLSQQIKSLENELGTILFQRDSHSASLTQSGSMLLPLAIQTLQDADACKAQVNDLKEMLTGELNIGVTYSFSHIITETVKSFVKEYPGVKLNIFYRNMGELMEALRHREVDLVLAFKPGQPYDEIESGDLFSDKLSVIMRKDHVLAGRKSISLEELNRYRIAIPAKGLQARNALEEYICIERSGLNVCLEINEANILLDIVQDNNFLTMLSGTSIRGREFLKAVPLNLPNNRMQGCVHTLKRVFHKRSAEVFMNMLREANIIQELSGKWQ
ncbi:MAG: LysR substrate-binding domain-containing protein [Bacteroidia bacterium]|nr:LysR substrate-binding domain-containing protein [Bacteroidia bacterium]